MAPHVVGQYAVRHYNEHGMPMPQRFEARCSICGAVWSSLCTTGAVRSHIATFAVRHLHRDPLAAERVERPGSLRRSGERE
jgi:hypothetical protein